MDHPRNGPCCAWGILSASDDKDPFPLYHGRGQAYARNPANQALCPPVYPEPSTELRTTLVRRPRLIERLNAGLRRKLTLVSAPAGSGKTTLVSSWLHHLADELPPALPVHPAWLSLDTGDNDTARFLADLPYLQAETTDLSELDVARVSVAKRAALYVEALEVDIEGRVMNIAPQANTIGGDVVYAVTVALQEQPPGLRWGMSVEVEIAAE
jgi:hypothetical protein